MVCEMYLQTDPSGSFMQHGQLDDYLHRDLPLAHWIEAYTSPSAASTRPIEQRNLLLAKLPQP